MELLVATYPSWAITVVRVTLGVIFFAHGSQKVLGWFGGYGLKGTTTYFISTGLPLPVAYAVCFFEFLGGLGLLLGSVGLGVVVLRNVLERRGELALLLAVGFRARALKWLVVSEHGALLLAGLSVGVVAAGVAVLPSLLSPGAEVPYRSMALTLAAVCASGLLWTWLATLLALRGRIIEALRNN